MSQAITTTVTPGTPTLFLINKDIHFQGYETLPNKLLHRFQSLAVIIYKLL